MSYQNKIDQVRNFLEEHNDNLKESNQINVDSFIESIRMLGAHDEEDLASLRYEDIAQCLPSLPEGGKPQFLAKKIANIFRERRQGVSTKEAEKMSLGELVRNYNPNQPNDPVGDRLDSISGGEPFLVFEDENTINFEKSLELLSEIQEGYPASATVLVDGDVYNTYAVGDKPDKYVEENPLYPGRPLRPNEELCDQTGRSWAGVSKKVRQFLRLLVKDKDGFDIDDAHSYIDLALQENAFQNLKERYPSTTALFKKKKQDGNLPDLRIKLNSSGNSLSTDYAHKVYGYHE